MPTPAESAPLPPLPAWKRAIDLAGVTLALPALVACTVAAAVVLQCNAPGPVFFRQERIGHLGRKFLIYKFRTMRLGAETGSHEAHVTSLLQSNRPMQKLDGRRDPRLVPGGWLVRASGLDELPQILNVLRGEMSLVGPRPCMAYEFDQYTAQQKQRCEALPGLTGLWQVSGKNRTTFDTMIRLDIAYAKQRSLWLDLKIIGLTLPALIGQVLDTTQQRALRTTTAPAPDGPRAPSASFGVPSERKPNPDSGVHAQT